MSTLDAVRRLVLLVLVAVAGILAIALIGVYVIARPLGLFGGAHDVRIPTHHAAVDGTDRFTGDIVEDEECVFLVGPSNQRILPVWPEGYRFEAWPRGGGALFDPTGRNLVVVAETLTVSGRRTAWAEVPSLVPVDGLRPSCGPIDLWFVNEVTVPPQ